MIRLCGIASAALRTKYPRRSRASGQFRRCLSQHDSFILLSVLFLDTGALNLTLHLRRSSSVYFHPFRARAVDEARESRRERERNGTRVSRWRVNGGARQRVDRETDRARAKQGKWKSYYSRSGRGSRIWLAMGSILSRKIKTPVFSPYIRITL